VLGAAGERKQSEKFPSLRPAKRKISLGSLWGRRKDQGEKKKERRGDVGSGITSQKLGADL